MNAKVSKITSLLAGAAILVLAAACTEVKAGDLKTETQSVEPGSAKAVRVDVTLGAGTLNIGGNASKLLDASFTYNVAAWKPEVKYNVTGDQGNLTIKQPDSNGDIPLIKIDQDVRYEWNLKLGNNVPTDLNVSLGAGVTDLELNNVDLTGLQLNTGAGQTTVNLNGNYKHNIDASIKAGASEITVKLPHDIGVRVNVSQGLGDTSTAGLHRNGDHYENDAYGKTDASINLDVQGGVSSVRLEVEK